MRISEYRENDKSEDGDDFTYYDIVDTIRLFWEILLNFLCLVRNAILFVVTFYGKTLSKSTTCVKYFQGIQERKSPTKMSTTSTVRRFNSLTKSYSSSEPVRNLHKIGTKSADANDVFYTQLKDLKLLDSNINNNDVDSTINSQEFTERCWDSGEGNRTAPNESTLDINNKQKDEIEPYKVAQYREAILKYSRISFSDFTSLFNKFVRENGRDFSKADLLHWLSRFTKFIYLKKEINGEPREVREQLSFRAIQSKRDSLAERLYTLREENEMNLSLEEFCENLRNCHINPIKKLLSVIKGGAGDMIQQEKNFKENIFMKTKLEEGINSYQTERNYQTRTETLDLEKEKISQRETGNVPFQQNTSNNRRKKTPKFQKPREEAERKKCPDLIDFENMYQNSKLQMQKIDNQHPAPNRDPESCISTSIYSTVNGYVKVSQYLETSVTKKLENAPVFQQCRSISFYVDYLNETDPLPEGVEIKPLPPGGLEEVLKTGPPMTDNEYAELEKLRLLYEKESPQEQCTAMETLTTTTAQEFENSMFKGDPKVLAKELNDAMAREKLNIFKAIPNYTLPDNETKTVEEPGHKMRRFIPVRRRLQTQSAEKEVATTETQPKETSTNQIKEITSKKTKNTNDVNIHKQDKKQNDTTIQDTILTKTPYEDEEQNDTTIQNRLPKDIKLNEAEANITKIQETEQKCMYNQYTDQNINNMCTRKTQEQQLFEQLPPLNFIDTDKTENEATESTQEPAFLETSATVDYSRHVVEPSHGDRPNKKKLQSRIKEKIKTKGEANKHLKVKKEKPAYFYEEFEEDLDLSVEDGKDNELEDSVTEQNEELNTSSTVVCATDQPQILDNREYMMVPEEIIRITDPRLKDIEDKYSVASPPDKKDKKKRKDKKAKAPKSIPISFVSDFLN